MMNYQVTVLSKWGQFLYRAGLRSKYIASHGSPRDLRQLHIACQNAELLLKMQEENKRLFAAVSDEPLTAQGWREFAKLKMRMYPTLQQFIQDANLYEWPTLVTAFIPAATVSAEPAADIQNVPTSEELVTENVNAE